MGTTVEDVVIVGAGIAGLATAVALKRAGIEALVLEKSEGLRTTGAALTLFPNAWIALDALGVSHKLASYTPSRKNHVTDLDTGEVQTVSLIKANGDAVGPRSVHRKALLEALADELPIHSIRFSSKISAIDTQQYEGSSIAIVHIENGTVIKAKVLIGCDGVHSVVSRLLGLSEPVHSGRSAVRGLAVYPQGHGLEQEVRQYVGLGRRAGFVPLTDKEIFWFFSGTTPAKGTSLAKDPEEIQKEILENYAKDLPPIYLDVVQHADVSTLTWAPLMFRYPWNVVFSSLSKQNITVAGDAMHPMTPDLAQGGCSALEDAAILGRHIGTSFKQNGHVLVPKEMSEVLSKYVEERRWRVVFLIAGSYISGWVQQGGSGWGMKFLRDAIFYKFIFPKMVSYVNYVDCGKLDF
ncbi:PREDICTED: zeaxanthin epoxidase, chloroplastic-like [Fragaria vesca subsp. vesca]|uniref:zeaxanthin epoxidase, chloroplastic-like n=1 Tax=Fragaria vesca subsp. vesca TaxID=101020 RepID=UPI0002C37059|nr:PREDICTED: zeaxanthin epoxidase, chloroplastic-like [Fragaria vesca subsp. vesca]